MVSRMKNGIAYDFSLDWEAIEKAETEDPEWDIFTAMHGISDKPRFTALYKLSRYIGWEYKDFVKAGFSVGELAEIMYACLEEAGFRSDQLEPTVSSTDLVGPQI